MSHKIIGLTAIFILCGSTTVFAQSKPADQQRGSSSRRHGPNLTGSVPEAGEPNSITAENQSDQYAQNSTFRTLARESSSDETIP
jgi:hypothetical protein